MEWLDRTLIAGPHFCLCLNEEDYRQALKDIDNEDWDHEWVKSGGALAHWFKTESSLTVIITIDISKKRPIEEIHAMLVHEAVHMWQKFKEHINEQNPSIEFEAYSLQVICMRLFYSYSEQTKIRK